jgi:hypothetical protein
MAGQNVTLILLDGHYAVVKLDRNAAIPPWATSGDFVSITRTMDELSIVCSESMVTDQCTSERGWRCFRVAGQIAFSTVGVLASLTDPLARAGISLFAISTFDTDYLLVKRIDLDRAIAVLRQYGHSIL